MCLNEYVNWGGVFVSPRAEVVHLQNPWAVCDNGHLRRQSIGAFIYGLFAVNTELVCRRVKLWLGFSAIALKRSKDWRNGMAPMRLIRAFQTGWESGRTHLHEVIKTRDSLAKFWRPNKPIGCYFRVDCAKRHISGTALRPQPL